jgi:hypothetical protein
MAWYFIYRQTNFKYILNRYSQVCKAQNSLIKITPKKELTGKLQTASKSEFQANISEIKALKGELLKVSIY